jgi:hypothetical protein
MDNVQKHNICTNRLLFFEKKKYGGIHIQLDTDTYKDRQQSDLIGPFLFLLYYMWIWNGTSSTFSKGDQLCKRYKCKQDPDISFETGRLCVLPHGTADIKGVHYACWLAKGDEQAKISSQRNDWTRNGWL